MRRMLALVASSLVMGGCAAVPVPIVKAGAAVFAKAETEPVGTANADAADDPAIWRNPADPSASLIVATDKKAGLYVYGLDGKPRAFVAAGQLNNVDLVERGGEIIVVASDRNDIANAKLQVYRLDGSTAQLQPLGSAVGGSGEAYGVCLWQDGGILYAFSVLKSGRVEQVRIDTSGNALPTSTIVRSLSLGSQGEGCVVDPRTRQLYVGEEAVGIWRFAAGALDPVAGTLVARADGTQLHADVEGLALVPEGADGGYLVASSQGNYSYSVYALPTLASAGRFHIGAGAVGSVEETDGIAIALGDFGSSYPAGLLVAQDGMNEPLAQNFKLVSWGDVLNALSVSDVTAAAR